MTDPIALSGLLMFLLLATAAPTAQPNYVRIDADPIALTHVDVIDGTGAPVKRDQSIVIGSERISAVGPAGEVIPPAGAQTLELRGRTVIPGLVGMHDHLFYVTLGTGRQVSAPRTLAHLYLANGVTSIRTAGAIDLQQDIAIKQEIDAGREVGPTIHLSSPYLGAAPSIPALEAAVASFADAGVTSVKAYTSLRREELAAAIRVAKARGMKVTGHLCAVGFREAAALGIDNLEHGIIVDSGLSSGKRPDDCPPWNDLVAELTRMNVSSAPIQATIKELVQRGVAVTSTLAVFETFGARTSFFDRRVEPLMVTTSWNEYLRQVEERASNPQAYIVWTAALGLEMAFERRFVEAGGLLMAGADPTGWGGTIAGFADQRNVELLVEAGFTPEQAIQIATSNGATFLGEGARVGTIETGKQADLVVVRGDPAGNIADIRNVEVVFKDGVGYDPQTLLDAEASALGTRSWWWWLGVGAGPAIVLLWIMRRISSSRTKTAVRKHTYGR